MAGLVLIEEKYILDLKTIGSDNNFKNETFLLISLVTLLRKKHHFASF